MGGSQLTALKAKAHLARNYKMSKSGAVQRFCGDVISAGKFLDNSETTKILKAQQDKLAKEGFLPSDMDAVCKFHVYWFQSSDFGKHASLVFTSNKEHCVTTELQWYAPSGVHTCLPWANGFLLSHYPERSSNMRYIGAVKSSAKSLIDAGIRAMRKIRQVREVYKQLSGLLQLSLEGTWSRNRVD